MAEDKWGCEAIRAHWNSRSGLGLWAGTRDIIAKQLEIEAISAHVRNGMRILEIGCGNGVTAIELARRFGIDLVGMDFAEEMVAAATAMAADQDLKGSVKFQIGDVRNLAGITQRFDLIYTERALINLPDWPAQERAIIDIVGLLLNGGLYVMCENSQDGLDKINVLRERIGLPRIFPPWHNRYLRDDELDQLRMPVARLEKIVFYSSTYYFLSRIVNAWLAAHEGREPDYESPLNRLALRLPPIGDWGQGRIWLWRRFG